MKSYRKILLALSLIIAGLLSTQSVIFAQTGLDYTLDANYGEIALQSGFTPDPFQVNITSGGSINANSSLVSCNGYVTTEPDYTVSWSGTSTLLRFFFESNGDTTLIINDSNGNWQCNDDSFGTLNPTIDFDNPSEGIYNIWVGSFVLGNPLSGVLNITESSSVVPGSPASSNPANPSNPSNPSNPAAAIGLDYTLNTNNGEIALQTGFTPDPFQVDITSGGSINTGNLLPNCNGFATAAPDYRLSWSGTSTLLRFFFESDKDTTLIINDPNGN
ncbi:MAG: hypothetical protein Q9P44_16470 [Anaerolineae bacterium]|nr:hypothetical protein [Anaerolineae bacterium]